MATNAVVQRTKPDSTVFWLDLSNSRLVDPASNIKPDWYTKPVRFAREEPPAGTARMGPPLAYRCLNWRRHILTRPSSRLGCSIPKPERRHRRRWSGSDGSSEPLVESASHLPAHFIHSEAASVAFNKHGHKFLMTLEVSTTHTQEVTLNAYESAVQLMHREQESQPGEYVSCSSNRQSCPSAFIQNTTTRNLSSDAWA